MRRRDAQAPPVFVECPGMMLDGWHAPVQRIPASLRDLLEYERDLALWPCWALPRHRHDDCHSRASSSPPPSWLRHEDCHSRASSLEPFGDAEDAL